MNFFIGFFVQFRRSSQTNDRDCVVFNVEREIGPSIPVQVDRKIWNAEEWFLDVNQFGGERRLRLATRDDDSSCDREIAVKPR